MHNNKIQQGQALITLLFFTVIGITLIAAAAMVTIGNLTATSTAEQGTIAYYVAESGAEDALLQLLRYPPNSATPYTGGSVPVTNGNATITVTVVGNTATIKSVGSYANARRVVQVTVTNGSNGWAATAWQEINN